MAIIIKLRALPEFNFPARLMQKILVTHWVTVTFRANHVTRTAEFQPQTKMLWGKILLVFLIISRLFVEIVQGFKELIGRALGTTQTDQSRRTGRQYRSRSQAASVKIRASYYSILSTYYYSTSTFWSGPKSTER